MKVIPFQRLICPLDHDLLRCTGKAWVCARGHSFDVARKGYVNLLPVQAKRSRDPGDHKSMVAARQRFLGGGHYEQIALAVNSAILSQAEPGVALSCLDAGCGEGYYLRSLAAAEGDQPLELIGVDISKWAVMAAARQERRPSWIVASNARLPVLSNSVDCLLCMFGFPVYEEFSRVLKPDGLLLKVDAGEAHLQELRDVIYPTQKSKCPDNEWIAKEFELLSTASVTYSLQLEDTEAIADLLAMTPHYYRAGDEGREKLGKLGNLSVTVDVAMSTLKVS